jgi:flagellar hook-basal body complex protein FliE
MTMVLGQKGGVSKIVHEYTSASVDFETAKVIRGR